MTKVLDVEAMSPKAYMREFDALCARLLELGAGRPGREPGEDDVSYLHSMRAAIVQAAERLAGE
jgi:hypothetical protein